MDEKLLGDMLSEKLQLLKSDFKKEREDDATGFEQKLSKAFTDLQKEMDDNIIALKESLKPVESTKALSFDQAFKKSITDQKDEFASLVKSGKAGTLDLKAFNYSDFTGYEDFATTFVQNPIVNPYEAFHYRRVFPIGRMSGEFVTYPKELATVGGADTWVVGSGAKPEIEPKLETYTATASWIAGLVKSIPVSMVEDLTFMSSFLNQKAQNELVKAEDLTLQNGGNTISGILQEAVLYDGSATIFVEKLIDAMFRQLADAHFSATAIVISNADYTSMLINKASGGSGTYDLPAIVGLRPDGTLTIAGVPVYATSYLSEGQGIVGDFRESTMLVRSNPRLRMFDQNADDAEKNLLLMRIEERIALAVYHQSAFVKLEAFS
jgi:HK97 family phage major capsid protein